MKKVLTFWVRLLKDVVVVQETPTLLSGLTVSDIALCCTGRETAPCPEGPSVESNAKRIRHEARSRAKSLLEVFNVLTYRGRGVCTVKCYETVSVLMTRSQTSGSWSLVR